jgi:uncharacterized protein
LSKGDLVLEIRDPIHGSIELTPSETAVIDNRFFQRLRNIKQLGFTEFSFPGATHNRYMHSLGAMHLAGLAFDQIFQGFPFAAKETRWKLRQTVRLASLLHDIGHGPLSHTTEEVMPELSTLKIAVYPKKENRRANHEDYTIKIITDSDLTEVLKNNFKDLAPIHIAMLVDKDLKADNDFFIENGVDFRPLLSQIVSSELDVDRMDYLARDSYYCGTSYGHVDSDWLIANLTYYKSKDGRLNLALNRRAVYTFDDFLISRYHMYLMVYFHHKGIIYDEMLLRYLRSKDCDFRIPAELNEYVKYDDYKLHTQMGVSSNEWARMIAEREPFRMVFETHDTQSEIDNLEKMFKKEGMEVIRASSTGRLSKYYTEDLSDGEPIYVLDRSGSRGTRVTKIEDTTEVFEKYQKARKIERLYVSRANYLKAQKLINN